MQKFCINGIFICIFHIKVVPLQPTSLTESEQMLKVSCIRYCNEVEDDALDEYWGQVFVEIDGEKYIVKEYGNKKQE